MSLRFQHFQLVDICVTLLCASFSAILYNSRASAGRTAATDSIPCQAYLLHNQVTHARLLPEDAKHAFTYPTIALLVSVDALESHKLDLGRGWIFGYGGLLGRITGLRPDPYLSRQPGSIKTKLEHFLRTRGYLYSQQALPDFWMMTMPSFLGFEGINPLSVYFCYDEQDRFWLAIMEVHNTFGESHIYTLEAGKDEDINPANGYDHQWTFRREFHVSPFNDRSGFYTISIKQPPYPPTQHIDGNVHKYPPPKPSVRVHLYTASEDLHKKGRLKLTALFRPTYSTPLTARSLLLSLLEAPFGLLLTMPRILYMAWILHYKKHLDVYLRPEPIPASIDWPARSKRTPGGVKWLEEGFLDHLAHRRVERFLQQRVQEAEIKVTLVAADPLVPHSIFSPDRTSASIELVISYFSPHFFTILFLCPSAEHALLLGCDSEHIFDVSSRDDFLRVFRSPINLTTEQDTHNQLQNLRRQSIRLDIPLEIPYSHYLDKNTIYDTVGAGMIILTHRILNCVEKWLFAVTRARVVSGQEPWKRWDRAYSVFQGDRKS